MSEIVSTAPPSEWWQCVIVFANGNSSTIGANRFDSIISAVTDTIYTWNAPVKEFHIHKINANRIKQGRVLECVS